jgi:hypothetical protein
MAILSRQIGWGTESNLLWQILKQLKQLASVIFSLKQAATPKYKVYTALLSQSGGSDPLNISSGDLTIGVTYYIDDAGGGDFTNVGAPNNDNGTYFVATGTTPNSWGTSANLIYDAGAPVTNVLENTIGNVWFIYSITGVYELQSYNLFTTGKTTAIMSTPIEGGDSTFPGIYSMGFAGDATIIICTTRLTDLAQRDGYLNDTLIEVRVYN